MRLGEVLRALVLIFVMEKSFQTSPDYVAVEYSPDDASSFVSLDLESEKRGSIIYLYFKSKNGNNRTLLSTHNHKWAYYLIHRGDELHLETYSTDGDKYNYQFKYEDNFVFRIYFDNLCFFYVYPVSDLRFIGRKIAPLDQDEPYFTEEGKCRLFIGGANKPYGNSFDDTVFAVRGDVYSNQFCFETMDYSLHESILFPHKSGNVSERKIPFSKLCKKKWKVLVANEQEVNGHEAIQTDYCQRFGGRYFKHGELELLQNELLEEVKSKCRSRNEEESTMVWTEERCTALDLATLNKTRSCYPNNACFLCFIPKPKITLRSEKLGNFPDITLSDSEEGAEPFSLESEDVVIKKLNASWHLRFKRISDEYSLNSSRLPFGKREWHGKLTKGVTDVISINNCQERGSCHEGSCFTLGEDTCVKAKTCKDGRDICEEGFPYYIEEKYQGEPDGNYNSFIEIDDYFASLEEVKDIELKDKGIKITLRFSFKWYDRKIGFHDIKNQEINGSKLPFSPSANLILSKCDSKENLLLNVSSNKYSTYDGLIWNNFTASFHLPCQFLYQDFPFGRHTCKICLSFKGCDASNLEFFWFRSLISNDSKIAGAFLLKNITQTLLDDESRFEILTQLETSPKLSNYHTLTSFIPTLLMSFVAYCTLYFNMKNFAERIGLSATSLLTLVVLFTDASERIDVTTAYAKFIDSWFIGSVVFAATIVVINAVLHYLSWHRVRGWKYFKFSFWKGLLRRGRAGSVDITRPDVDIEAGLGVTAEEHEMVSPTENPPPNNGSDAEEEETDSPTSLARRINVAARVLLLCVIAAGVGVLVYK